MGKEVEKGWEKQDHRKVESTFCKINWPISGQEDIKILQQTMPSPSPNFKSWKEEPVGKSVASSYPQEIHNRGEIMDTWLG